MYLSDWYARLAPFRSIGWWLHVTRWLFFHHTVCDDNDDDENQAASTTATVRCYLIRHPLLGTPASYTARKKRNWLTTTVDGKRGGRGTGQLINFHSSARAAATCVSANKEKSWNTSKQVEQPTSTYISHHCKQKPAPSTLQSTARDSDRSESYILDKPQCVHGDDDDDRGKGIFILYSQLPALEDDDKCLKTFRGVFTLEYKIIFSSLDWIE